MNQRYKPYLLCFILSILTGCSNSVRGIPTVEVRIISSSLVQTVPPTTAVTCPVTIANNNTPSHAWPEPTWHGNGKLWVVLWPKGVVAVPPANLDPDGSIWTKFAWIRGEGVVGELSIQGQRIDAQAPPLKSAFVSYGSKGFQPSTIIFPTFGCWKVVGKAGDATLTFVTLVQKVNGIQ